MQKWSSRFSSGVLITLITRGFHILLAFCNKLLIARIFGVGGIGFFTYLASFIGVATTIGDCGVLRANIYAVARNSGMTRQMIKLSFMVAFLVGGLTLVLSLQSSLFKAFIPSSKIWIVISITMMLIVIYLRGILLGKQKFLEYNLIDLAMNGSFLISILFLTYVITIRDVQEIVYAYFFSIIVTICITFFFLRYELKLGFPSREAIRYLGVGSRGYLLNIIGYLVIRSDIFLVQFYLGSYSVGLYGVAVAVAEMIWIFPSVIGQILFPKIAHARDTISQVATTEYIVRLVTLIGLIEVTVFVLAGKFLLNIFGPDFMKSYTPLLFLLPGIFTMSISQPLGSYFAGKGYPPIVILAAGISFLVNLIINIILIPRWGIIGASFSTSIAYTIHLIILIYAFIHITKSNWKNLFIIKKDDSKFFLNIIFELIKSKKSSF